MIAVNNSVAFVQHEVLLDPNGRYIILICEVNNVPYTIANIYAPNAGQLTFLCKILKKTLHLQKGS